MRLQRPLLFWLAKNSLCLLFGLVLVLGFASPLVAQMDTRGTVLIEFTGMVQGLPGNDVLTLQVKSQKILFALHDVHSSGQRFLRERFLSDLRIRTPSMYVRGPDYLLEELLAEEPNKRALKMRGLYYSDSRAFVINRLSQFHGNKPEH
jgi:hypothetical protein